MPGPTQVTLSLTGNVNNQPVTASGTLVVDPRAGTKTGDILVNQPPGSVTVFPDGYAIPMPKCFVGARPAHSTKLVNPLRLLGRRFVSLRVTSLGPLGTLSHCEQASLTGNTLTSTQVVFGKLRHDQVRKVARVRETIAVSGPDHLTSKGSYSLETHSGKVIPIRYQQVYRSLTPNAPLFHSHKHKKFLLKAEVHPVHRGKVVSIDTNSTIEYI